MRKQNCILWSRGVGARSPFGFGGRLVPVLSGVLDIDFREGLFRALG